ncbi:MAG: triose-phosphate isomerase [Vicinamibacterales bacterium]
MRTPLVAANWKMFKTVREAVGYVGDLRGLLGAISGVDVVIAPPFTALAAVADACRSTAFGVSGQNLHWEKEGAFTGEVSAAMLADAGARYAIVGHSERRRLFGEADDVVNRKLRAAIAHGLTPIVCVGETLDERQSGRTLAVLDRQLNAGLDGVAASQVAALVLAYEPVWAIGTGVNATPAQAGEAHAHIRQRLRQWFGADTADASRVIYGGSVKPDNIVALVAQPDIDGALVGGASLAAASFAEIVRGSLKAV